MNGNRYLLDSNIIIAFFSNELIVLKKFEQELFNLLIPAISIGELCFGAYNSIKKEENLRIIENFTSALSILEVDSSTAKIYGSIKSVLKQNGTPIPENDIWIAALASQHKLTLVTRDNHFRLIPDLTIKDWVQV
ncbi:MAG: type II toxin-antitoxin system VapC family toxin [Opitutaceae bacterium]|nr:type II toxin-antitoxin system VapC family toxin [Cytophagales bacterium]